MARGMRGSRTARMTLPKPHFRERGTEVSNRGKLGTKGRSVGRGRRR